MSKHRTIENAEDVAKLPWAGNAYSDAPLFKMCERYVKASTTEFEAKRRALYLMGLHGMGIDEAVTDTEVTSFLEDGA